MKTYSRLSTESEHQFKLVNLNQLQTKQTKKKKYFKKKIKVKLRHSKSPQLTVGARGCSARNRPCAVGTASDVIYLYRLVRDAHRIAYGNWFESAASKWTQNDDGDQRAAMAYGEKRVIINFMINEWIGVVCSSSRCRRLVHHINGSRMACAPVPLYGRHNALHPIWHLQMLTLDTHSHVHDELVGAACAV